MYYEAIEFPTKYLRFLYLKIQKIYEHIYFVIVSCLPLFVWWNLLFTYQWNEKVPLLSLDLCVLRQKKKKCLFPETRPTLIFCPEPKVFYCLGLQNAIKWKLSVA